MVFFSPNANKRHEKAQCRSATVKKYMDFAFVMCDY